MEKNVEKVVEIPYKDFIKFLKEFENCKSKLREKEKIINELKELIKESKVKK